MMRESLRKKGRVTRMKESNKDQYLLKSLDSALTEVHLVQKDIPKFDKYNNAGVIENVETGWMETIFRKISMFLGYTFQTEAEFE